MKRTKGQRKRFIENSCLRKKRYPSESAAMDMIKLAVLSRDIPGADRLHPYYCENCMGWHNGHSNNKTDTLDKIFK